MYKQITLIFAAALAISQLTQAQVVVLDDNFDSGTNPGYTISGGGTITIENGTTSQLTGNAVLISTNSNNRTMERDLDQAVTLSNVNDYIEVSLDYRFAATLDDNSGSTVNLFSSTSQFGMNFNPSAGSNAGTYFTNEDNNSGRFNTIASGTSAQSLTLRLTVTSATEVQMLASFNGSPVSASNSQLIGVSSTDGIGSPLTFNELSLGWTSGNSGDIFYDNIQVVTNVPEPSSLGLIGLGLSGLYLLRLRRFH